MAPAPGGFGPLGEVFFDDAGSDVAGVGDVDGDGFDDVLIGASGQDGGIPMRGRPT